MGNFQYPQGQLYLQGIIRRNLNNLKSYSISIKNLETSIKIAVEDWKMNRNKEMALLSKTQNLRHLRHMQLVFIANEEIILQKRSWSGPKAANRSKRFQQLQLAENVEEG